MGLARLFSIIVFLSMSVAQGSIGALPYTGGFSPGEAQRRIEDELHNKSLHLMPLYGPYRARPLCDANGKWVMVYWQPTDSMLYLAWSDDHLPAVEYFQVGKLAVAMRQFFDTASVKKQIYKEKGDGVCRLELQICNGGCEFDCKAASKIYWRVLLCNGEEYFYFWNLNLVNPQVLRRGWFKFIEREQ